MRINWGQTGLTPISTLKNGERPVCPRITKPDKPQKGLKQDKDGRWWEWKGHEGKWVPKPPGFNPDTAKKVGIGAAIVGGAVVTGHAIAGCFASGACELGLAAAF
jgi:hypothetical protein